MLFTVILHRRPLPVVFVRQHSIIAQVRVCLDKRCPCGAHLFSGRHCFQIGVIGEEEYARFSGPLPAFIAAVFVFREARTIEVR